ncbi:UNVERIFIED_CONTAM: hypothetical protein Sradi_5737600 [Sesamum radiatum]|uniref:Reverse transcriptase n=1 Tax=Sesamum radiatum TaxID=300843 RepID=A0AAW2L3G1_SESRA
MQCLWLILKYFGKASGLLINPHESIMIFSKNVEERSRHEMAEVIRVSIVPKHDKYLGLPTVAGRSKKEISELPDSLVSEIESLMSNFLSNRGEALKIHLLGWSKLCISCKEGSLGFRRLREFNIDLLAKQAWKIALIPGGTLHSVLRHKYFCQSSFFATGLGSSLSYTWRSVQGTQDLLAAGIRWKTRDDLSIQILGHPWLPKLSTFPVRKLISLLTKAKELSSLMMNTNGIRI